MAMMLLSQPAAPATPPRHRSASAPAMAASSPLSKTTSIGSEEVAESAMVKAGSTLWAAEGAAAQESAAEQPEPAAPGSAEREEETVSGAVKGAAWQAGQAVGSVAASAAQGAGAAVESVASTAGDVAQSVHDATEAAAGKVAVATSGVRQALQGAAAKAAEEVQQAVSEVTTICMGSGFTTTICWSCRTRTPVLLTSLALQSTCLKPSCCLMQHHKPWVLTRCLRVAAASYRCQRACGARPHAAAPGSTPFRPGTHQYLTCASWPLPLHV